MASSLKNLSVFDSPVPCAEKYKFGVVVAEWNSDITGKLLEGAIKLLTDSKVKEENIIVKKVPGTYELTLGAQFLFEYTDVDAVITLGCVIQGDTRHFDFICDGVTNGINYVQIKYNKPIAFGVLTVNDMQQAVDRSGGKHGNKGEEAAATAIKMVAIKNEF